MSRGLEILYILACPQLLAVVALLSLRRAPWLALFTAPAVATVSSFCVMRWELGLDTSGIVHPDRYFCGLFGISVGLAPIGLGAIHGMLAFTITGVILLHEDHRHRRLAAAVGREAS